jgi:hypothetical protein
MCINICNLCPNEVVGKLLKFIVNCCQGEIEELHEIFVRMLF